MVRHPTKPSEGTNHARQILPQTSSFISPHLSFKKIPRKEKVPLRTVLTPVRPAAVAFRPFLLVLYEHKS